MDIVIIVIICLIGLLFAFYLTVDERRLHAHWNQLLDGLKYSTKDFYQLLEEELQKHNITGLIAVEQEYQEGNSFSASRLYLHVVWKEYRYDICFAPFGNGMFVSWWMYSEPSGFERFLYGIPGIGESLAHSLYPYTYYRIDTADMFMTYAQKSVLTVVDKIMKEQNLRLIPENDRKPVLKDIFSR